MKSQRLSRLLIVCFILNVHFAHSQDKMTWWRDAKFGMFIHWGIYAVPGRGEWVMLLERIPIPEYEKFAEQFNATQFDAEEWVSTAKQAGMKYLVITAKHHDGFCMWNTDVTDYNVVDRTPFGRDVIGELGQACENQGIIFGVYYSIDDWHHPDARSAETMARYRDEYVFPQVQELIQNYPVHILWFDGDWLYGWTDQNGIALYQHCISLNPQIIVNNRVKRTMADAGDYLTPEQEIPETPPDRDWESCMTINGTWGYNYGDTYWKSAQTLIRNLLEINSKGGNLLLNVGPTADGIIPRPSVDVLGDMGQWLAIYGESIYGTRTSPIQNAGFGRVTFKGNSYFLHVWMMNSAKIIQLPFALKHEATLTVLQDNSPVPFTIYPNVVTIDMNGVTPDPIATVLHFQPQDFVTANADGCFILTTDKVRLVGDKLCIETLGNVGCWTDSDDYVFWRLRTDGAARFEVKIEYATDPSSAGHEMAIQVGGEEIRFTSVSTGGWQTYQEFSLGEILLQSGWSDLIVRPAGMNGAYINLLRVTLVPSIRCPHITHIHINPDRTAQLCWTGISGVNTYHVYRDTIPYFTPDKVNATNRTAANVTDQEASAAGIQWNDPQVVAGNSQNNYYYLVTASGAFESENSNRCGIANFPLRTTQSTMFNHIAFPFQDETISDAMTLMQKIPVCNSVVRWDPAYQGFEQAIQSLPQSNFTVEPGHAYYVNVKSDSIWTLTGDYANPVYDLISTSTTGFNEIMLPLDKSNLNMASDLMADIPNCNSVARWNTEIQEYEQYVPELPLSDFKVKSGCPYSVNVTANCRWPSSGTEKKMTASRADKTENKMSQAPHLVWGKIAGWVKDSPKTDFHFTASLSTMPDRILTDQTPGCGIRGNVWFVQLGALKSPWRAGDILRVTLTDSKNTYTENVEIPLTCNPADQAQAADARQSGLVTEFRLLQNHPNPYNSETVIPFDIPRECRIHLKIHDVLGREVGQIVNASFQPGHHEITFDGSGLSSGIYLYRIEADDFQMIRKMVIVK